MPSEGVTIFLQSPFPLSETETQNLRPEFIYSAPRVDIPKLWKDIPSAEFVLDNDQKRTVNEEVMQYVVGFPDSQSGGKVNGDLLVVSGVCTWYFHRFRIYFWLETLYHLIEEIKILAKKHDRLLVFTHLRELKNVTEFLPENVELSFVEVPKQKRNLKSMINFVFASGIRLMKSIFQARGLKNYAHIIHRNPHFEHNYLNLKTLKQERDNLYCGYLMQVGEKEFLFLDEITNPSFRSKETFSLKKRFLKGYRSGKTLFMEGIYFKGILSGKVRRQLKAGELSLKASYLEMNRSAQKLEHKLIALKLQGLHKSTNFYLFRFFACKAFFSKHSFASVTAVGENNSRVKGILEAARSRGVTTIGIQHGTSSAFNPNFNFKQHDLQYKPMPDHTLLWAQKWAEFYEKEYNYRPESVFVTGQIRTDIIPKLKGVSKKEVFPQLDANKTTVMFASQPIKDEVLRKQAATDVLRMAKSHPEVELLIKMHPAELEEDYFHNLAQEIGCSNYLINREVDLYLALASCDIIITCWSTVGFETIYFDKPLIILDHMKQDQGGYYKNGVAFQATNGEELQDYVGGLLDGRYCRDKEKYEEFIKNNAHVIDGKAALRSYEFIKSIGG